MDEAPVDAEVIRELRTLQDDGNPGFLAELIDLFLSHGSQMLADLRTAFSAGNAAELLRLAHTLRGSAGGLGARRLSGLCAALEEDLRAGVRETVPAQIGAIEAEFARVRPVLEAERKR